MGLTKEQVASKCKTAGLNVKIEDGVVKLIFDGVQEKQMSPSEPLIFLLHTIKNRLKINLRR